MGASESTSRSNGTDEDEEHQHENNRRSGGSSMGAGALATAAVGVGVVAAIGFSRMLSNNTNTLERLEGANSTRSHIPQGCYKMTTDGGCNHDIHGPHENHGPGWYGGVLRDPHGNWVKGFRGYVSDTYSLTSELLSIYKGLELLDKLDIEGAILLNDNEEACKYVNGHEEYLRKSKIVRESWPIIEKCRDLKKKNGIQVNQIGGEYTKDAHKLAKMAKKKQEEYEEIEELPNELMSFFY